MGKVNGKKSSINEWQLVVKGDSDKINSFSNKILKDLKHKSAKIRTIAQIIINNKSSETSSVKDNIAGLCFFNSYTPWDEDVQSYMESLISFGRDDLNLRVSFASLGLDLDQYYFDIDDSLPIEYVTYLKEYQL